MELENLREKNQKIEKSAIKEPLRDHLRKRYTLGNLQNDLEAKPQKQFLELKEERRTFKT